MLEVKSNDGVDVLTHQHLNADSNQSIFPVVWIQQFNTIVSD